MKGESTIRKRFHKPNHFLNKEGKLDISCLKEIFKNFHPEDFRRELDLWPQVAFSNDQSAYDEGWAREDLMDFIYELRKLIEAFYILNKGRSCAKNDSFGKGPQKKMKQSSRELNFHSLLTEEERRKPVLAIKEFCKTFSSEYAKAEILDLLDALVTYEGQKKIYKDNLVLFYQHLYWLLKLAYKMEKIDA